MRDDEVNWTATERPMPPGTMQQIERYIRSSRFDTLQSDPDDRFSRRISELESRIEHISSEVSFILFLSSATLAILIAMLIIKAMA